ncbi:hypothetical protein BKH43_08010 [Helicobacter sp. 13S00401-1]|uniref:peptidase dimerization domain-containing protein n=1 Tax=Helicobacter sp. 13S00401-1 TaxID=1905758 RepID=UPI000BA70584|nr:peptidase dimerization domain-containing protein [Helicobacter sp. 13S00401-1]PAF47987.1 hypothetical protein BKH43_08010 [Helicobacter sp. 13S00401-1]
MDKLQKVLDIFYDLCKIPHPSFDTSKIKDFITKFCIENGYEIQSDGANLLASLKGTTPKVCLQAHMDMVLVPEGASIKVEKEGEFLKAKDSSLGADNGIGLSIMLYLISLKTPCEFLFTDDEEVGFIGASKLDLKVHSKLLLNLDSEVLGEVVTSSAGGFDASTILKLDKQDISSLNGIKSFALSFQGPGGHSGIDIGTNKSAFIDMLEFLKKLNLKEVYFSNLSAGNRRNAIPSLASITLHVAKDKASLENLSHSSKTFTLKEDDSKLEGAFKLSDLLEGLKPLKTGVLEANQTGILSSLNLSIVKSMDEGIELEFMGRANAKEFLDKNITALKKAFPSIDISNVYLPWESKPKDEALANLKRLSLEKLKLSFEKEGLPFKEVSIHAGLECGIIEERLKDITALSIGPTINNPHSIQERVDLKSVQKLICVVLDFLA